MPHQYNAKQHKETKPNYQLALIYRDLDSFGYTSSLITIKIGTPGHWLPSTLQQLLRDTSKLNSTSRLDQAAKITITLFHIPSSMNDWEIWNSRCPTLHHWTPCITSWNNLIIVIIVNRSSTMSSVRHIYTLALPLPCMLSYYIIECPQDLSLEPCVCIYRIQLMLFNNFFVNFATNNDLVSPLKWEQEMISTLFSYKTRKMLFTVGHFFAHAIAFNLDLASHGFLLEIADLL